MYMRKAYLAKDEAVGWVFKATFGKVRSRIKTAMHNGMTIFLAKDLVLKVK